jgi:hypothetical protein
MNGSLTEEAPVREIEIDLADGVCSIELEHGEIALTITTGYTALSVVFARNEARAVALALIEQSQTLLEEGDGNAH